MKIAPPPPALPAKIEKLLSELDKISGERTRHLEMARDLEKQEADLLPCVDLTDPKQFEQVNFLRRKREMIPGRIRAFDEAAAKITEQLRTECNDMIASHGAALDAKWEELTAAIAKDLEKYFGPQLKPLDYMEVIAAPRLPGPHSARMVAELSANRSRAGQILNKQKSLLKLQFPVWPPKRQADELIRMIAELEALSLTI